MLDIFLKPELIKCKYCSVEIPKPKITQKKSALKKGFKHIFCSRSCAASFNNSARNRKRKTSNCLMCKIVFAYGGSKHSGKFCTRQCASQYKNNLTVSKLQNNDPSIKTDARRKRALIQIKGYQCEICLTSNWQQKPLTLQLDHIDGDSDNNKLSNLRLLCPNCHSQTENFCSKNKKKGRLSKRKKYNQDYYRTIRTQML